MAKSTATVLQQLGVQRSNSAVSKVGEVTASRQESKSLRYQSSSVDVEKDLENLLVKQLGSELIPR